MPSDDRRALDSCARLHLDRRGRIGAYFGLGITGTVLGAIVVVLLAGLGAQEVSVRAAIIAVVAPQLSFLIAVKVSQIVAGYERIVLYEKFLAALAGTALALVIAGEPVWTGVDLATTGITTFLIFGRLGCLHVGCCHGRPHRWGIVYGHAHADAGFPRHLVGIRLFPIQLVESLLTIAIAATAFVVAIAPHAPGEVTAVALGAYGPVRFVHELARGDDDRPMALGLSEAQWIALITGAAITAAAWTAGFATRIPLTLASTAILVGAALLATLGRRRRHGPFALRHPVRLTELARALPALRPDLTVVETPGGLRLSGDPRGTHVTISAPDGGLAADGAAVLAAQIALLTRRDEIPVVRAGRTNGVFHLVWSQPLVAGQQAQ